MKKKVFGIIVSMLMTFTAICSVTGLERRDTWDLLFYINVTPQTGYVDHAGAEFDGTYFYTTTGFTNNLIHKYDIDGNLVKEFSIHGVSGLGDLAYDGEYFYGGSMGFEIFKMDFDSETIVGTIPSTERVRAIAYNDDLDAFYVCDWSYDLALIARDGTELDNFDTGVTAAARFGLAYDNISPDGPYLWIFDQSRLNEGERARIHQWDLASYEFTGVYHDVGADIGSGWGIAKGLFTTEDYMPGKYCIGGMMSDSGCPPFKRETGEFLFVYELYQINAPPNTPPKPIGPEVGMINVDYDFESFVSDPDEDNIYYMFDWGDDTNTGWLGPVYSGKTVDESHDWSEIGEFDVKIKAKDINENEGDWSEPLTVRISSPPDAPTITGETNGKVGEEYCWNISSVDPDDDDVMYTVEWGNGETTETECYPSGVEVEVCHSYNDEGTYIIKVKAKECPDGLVGPESTFTIIITKKSRAITHPFQWFLQKYSNLFPLLQKLLLL